MSHSSSATLFSLVVAAGIFAGGCAGTETGNPTLPTVELRVTAFSNDFGAVAVAKPGPKISVTRAFAELREIQLIPCGAGLPPPEFAPVSVELTQAPAFELDATGTDEKYCGAHIALAPSAAGALPELDGLSVFLEGTRADGTPFQIASAEPVGVDLHTNPPGTPFSAEGLLLGFNLATWLAGVDLDGATVEGSKVTVDVSHNTDALVVFEAQAALAPALYDDADGNGMLAGDNQPPAAGP
jgi:hypothetical protein